MVEYTVIREDGQQETVSRELGTIVLEADDGTEFRPYVVQNAEYDGEGESSRITTVCGESEQRLEAENPPDVTFEGIIGESQLDTAKQMRGQYATLVSKIHSGEVFIRRLILGQESNLVSVSLNGRERESAFTFQLQLRQPE